MMTRMMMSHCMCQRMLPRVKHLRRDHPHRPIPRNLKKGIQMKSIASLTASPKTKRSAGRSNHKTQTSKIASLLIHLANPHSFPVKDKHILPIKYKLLVQQTKGFGVWGLGFGVWGLGDR